MIKQVKSYWYYVFWGLMTAIVFTGQLVTASGYVYDALNGTLQGPSVAAAVLIIAKYQYQIAFVADQEINLLAALTEIMVECDFK